MRLVATACLAITPYAAASLAVRTLGHARPATMRPRPGCAFALAQASNAASVPLAARGLRQRPTGRRGGRRKVRRDGAAANQPRCASSHQGAARHLHRSRDERSGLRQALHSLVGSMPARSLCLVRLRRGSAQVRQAAATTRGLRPPSSYRHAVKYEAYCRCLRRMSASLRAIPAQPCRSRPALALAPGISRCRRRARLLWRHGIFAYRGVPGVPQRSTDTDSADATGRLLTGYVAQASPPAKNALEDARKSIRQLAPRKNPWPSVTGLAGSARRSDSGRKPVSVLNWM